MPTDNDFIELVDHEGNTIVDPDGNNLGSELRDHDKETHGAKEVEEDAST